MPEWDYNAPVAVRLSGKTILCRSWDGREGIRLEPSDGDDWKEIQEAFNTRSFTRKRGRGYSQHFSLSVSAARALAAYLKDWAEVYCGAREEPDVRADGRAMLKDANELLKRIEALSGQGEMK